MPPRATGSLGSSRSLARRIAYEREQRGWKQATLARQMTDAGFEMMQSTISKFERTDNPRRITVDELAAFSQVFGIRADQLLLPPEVAADRKFRQQLDAWRRARLAAAEAQGEITEYLQAHPEMEEVLRELLTDDDWTALNASVMEAMQTFRKRGTFEGATMPDLKRAHEQTEARRGKHC
jgi:transcriptional regulator with XRE-family HTH domain